MDGDVSKCEILIAAIAHNSVALEMSHLDVMDSCFSVMFRVMCHSCKATTPAEIAAAAKQFKEILVSSIDAAVFASLPPEGNA